MPKYMPQRSLVNQKLALALPMNALTHILACKTRKRTFIRSSSIKVKGYEPDYGNNDGRQFGNATDYSTNVSLRIGCCKVIRRLRDKQKANGILQ